MFSIVIPLYNKELSIKKTIKSVLNQNFKDFEIIVVNDGSTDNSLRVVEEIKDSRINIVNKENGGVSSARNRGIQEAKYDWIAFLDGDDLWLPNHLEELNFLILNYGIDNSVFCTSFIRAKSNEVKAKVMSLSSRNIERKLINDFFYSSIYEGFIMWTGCVMIKKNVFDKVGDFSNELSRGEDIEMWVKVARKFDIVYSSNVTAIYKIDTENSLSRTRSNFNKSYLSKIILKELVGYDRLYHKRIFIQKIRNSIKNGDLSSIIKIFQRW